MPRTALASYSVAILCVAAALAASATRLIDWQGLLVMGVAFAAVCTALGMIISRRARRDSTASMDEAPGTASS